MLKEIVGLFNRVIDELDINAATATVDGVRAAHPDATREQVVDRLIRSKIARTAGVGALTSGAAIIPGIGTVAALTFGAAADIGATFKLQAELVLEIAVVYARTLSVEERRTAVMLVTGVTAGTNQLAGRVGQRAMLALGERAAARTFAKALPFVGVAASAGLNALTTYVIGKRAEAYFRLEQGALGDTGEIVRALLGVDERAARTWFAEQARRSWDGARTGASTLAEAGRTNSRRLLTAGSAQANSARRTLDGLVRRVRERGGRNDADSDGGDSDAS